MQNSEEKLQEPLDPRTAHLVSQFKSSLESASQTSITYAVLEVLTSMLKESEELTIRGIQEELKWATMQLQQQAIAQDIIPHRTVLPIKAACEIFTHVINCVVSASTMDDIKKLKEKLLLKGQELCTMSLQTKSKIDKVSTKFLRDGLVLMTHGDSKLVEHVLLKAAIVKGVRFTLYVTEGQPNQIGIQLKERIEKATSNIDVKLILDSAIGVAIREVDYVIMGAEAVLENGGIVNKMGTYSTALIAKEFNKQFYVLADSLKFTKLFPLGQSDIDQYSRKGYWGGYNNGIADYTPPELITLMFTDLGIFTPSAVSDELIQFYSS